MDTRRDDQNLHNLFLSYCQILYLAKWYLAATKNHHSKTMLRKISMFSPCLFSFKVFFTDKRLIYWAKQLNKHMTTAQFHCNKCMMSCITLTHSFLVKNCIFFFYDKQIIFTIELTPTLIDTTEWCAEELSLILEGT